MTDTVDSMSLLCMTMRLPVGRRYSRQGSDHQRKTLGLESSAGACVNCRGKHLTWALHSHCSSYTTAPRLSRRLEGRKGSNSWNWCLADTTARVSVRERFVATVVKLMRRAMVAEFHRPHARTLAYVDRGQNQVAPILRQRSDASMIEWGLRPEFAPNLIEGMNAD